ncbi:luciferase-type oxidoreductase, BA3436 family [Cupriavidus sp. YR651]|uniref:TIGR03571 family LLM class oxidoreductase n=1 Tax=Cupriavidus sp. YR651 TaxID=1855315 RepID=UPI00087E3645|nr:TIGR03571 family LLM class oxidoreductase [Cupriavidus sp. YR651]SDD01729.1 luciferase-type oxidoreductase, BA3436 family [Cupriavidus sp. YR651]
MANALETLTSGSFSIGVELPLDNDWTPAGQAARQRDGRLPGEPDLAHHDELARLADRSGFRALWVRDVPLYDPQFGDAAQVFEAFSYLGYLAGITDRILLGTAAIVLPIRDPLLTLKAANTLDHLSNGRLLLGVASGDRPVEYPIFGRDFENRGVNFRTQVSMLRDGASHLPSGVTLLPRTRGALPLLVAGLAQQTANWVGQHMDGWLAYPGTPEDHVRRSGLWRGVAGNKPYITFIHLDLLANPDAPMQRHRFGGAVGRNGLVAELHAMREAGVNHIGLHFRRNQRPVKDAMEEIAAYVLPHFHTPPAATRS